MDSHDLKETSKIIKRNKPCSSTRGKQKITLWDCSMGYGDITNKHVDIIMI
jgi:hypothetical protein